MYTALFIISVIMFGYLMYVLVKPEKFYCTNCPDGRTRLPHREIHFKGFQR